MSPCEPPCAPCYAVVFTNQRTAEDEAGYAAMAQRMAELATAQPGYLGMDSVRDASGAGITVSYWASLEAIAAWRAHPEHLHAQQLGRTRWYAHYTLRVARVERGSRMAG